METARYEHDCDRCVYLGHWQKYDLYYCPGINALDTTVIARYGFQGDYTSGLVFAKAPFANAANPLTEALFRATRSGLCDSEGQPTH